MITNEEFQRIVFYMKKKAGINLQEKRVLVSGRLDNYMIRKGYQSYSEFMDIVEKFPAGQEAQYLVNALTTNHTYFGVNTNSFCILNRL